MRKPIITIAFAALLGTLAVSCQKETILDNASVLIADEAAYSVLYTIDGASYQINLVGEDSWNDFLNYMLDLVDEGHRVSFQKEMSSSSTLATKEVVSFTTTSREEAYAWDKKMYDNGYKVSIYYDKEKGVYYCEAIK